MASRTINQIRVDVQNAQIAVTNAHATYDAAVTSRTISEQVYEAEQKKYALGASTTYLVTQHLNDLTSARFNELNAQTTYAQAKLQLDQATGSILDHYNIQIEEAKNGRISRNPDPIPVVPPNGALNQRGGVSRPARGEPPVSCFVGQVPDLQRLLKPPLEFVEPAQAAQGAVAGRGPAPLHRLVNPVSLSATRTDQPSRIHYYNQ